MIIDEDVYLEHHGVKGMRWGQHVSQHIKERKDNKYRNPDGSPMTQKQVQKKKLDHRRRVVTGVRIGLSAAFIASMFAASGSNRMLPKTPPSAETSKFIEGTMGKTLKEIEIERNTHYQNAKRIKEFLDKNQGLN